jgi:hypothetical protein
VFKNVVNRIAPVLGVAPDTGGGSEPDVSALDGLYTPKDPKRDPARMAAAAAAAGPR